MVELALLAVGANASGMIEAQVTSTLVLQDLHAEKYLLDIHRPNYKLQSELCISASC